MSYYQPIQKFLTTEFVVKRDGLLKPTYQLTDGQYSFGMLKYEGIFKRQAVIETADQIWTLDILKWKKQDITGAKGEVLATLSYNFWGTKVTFTTNDGFTATFVKPSIWKSLTIWKAADGTDVVYIENRVFKTPVIKVNERAKQNKWLLMLAFLALQINLERQKQVAAASI